MNEIIIVVTLVLNAIMTITSVISCVFAFKAKNDAYSILNKLQSKSGNLNTNTGVNTGIMANNIDGGITL